MKQTISQDRGVSDQGAPATSGIIGWIEYRLPVFSFLDNSVGRKYPAPRNLNYWWNFGSVAGICLVLQILTGLFLAMHYTPEVAMAFNSVEHIMRSVNYGWLLRYAHAVGASMFFVVVYIHICRGLYYGSYKAPREILWWLGLVIFLLMMATAFMGYVLPWGQMSFWGATVITNLFSAIPGVGESIVTWLWGGFSVDNPTLNRFFALHFLLPFLIVGVVVLHIWALHQHGSNNPLGIDVKTPQDVIPFHPYYTYKDFLGFGVFFLIFAWFVFFSPNSLGHPDNYIEANPMVTPPHIVPEWYFLPFYAILRATPDIGIPFTNIVFISSKLAGVILMFASILIMFVLPWIDRCKVRSGAFRPVFKWLFWIFIINGVLLGYMGAQTADGYTLGIPNLIISRVALTIYFAYFIALWVISKNEKTLPLPESISKSVLDSQAAHAAHH
jgi:quinol-cytochrome oxidoreductase complex cytochrome b subunit